MMDTSTKPQDIVLSITSDVISKLQALNEHSHSSILDKVIAEMTEYSAAYANTVGSSRISSIIGKLSRLSEQNDFKFSYIQQVGTYTLTINDIYKFVYADHSHIDMLVDFINYVLRDVRVIMETDFNPTPSADQWVALDKLQKKVTTPELPTTSYKELVRPNIKDAQVQLFPNENPNDEPKVTMLSGTLEGHKKDMERLSKSSTSTEVIVTPVIEVAQLPTEVTRLTAEEIDEQKQANVDHLKKVKDSINEDVESKRQTRMRFRIGEIADGIGGTRGDVEKLRAPIEEWLADMSNDMTISLFDLVDLIHGTARVHDPMLTRLLIQVCIINRHHRLLDVPRFTETPKSKNTYMQLNTSDKELLVGVTLANLDVVEQHKHARTYGLYQLAIYVIDLCNKSSSLTVTENPEEIVSITVGVYNILLSKNLDGDFVYAADVNNQYDVSTADWFKSNKVIKAYLDRIEHITEEDKQRDTVSVISERIAERDVTMSTARLDTDSANEILEWALKLPHKSTNHIGTHMGHFDGTYIVTGNYPTGIVDGNVNYKQAAVVATRDTIAVFVKPKTGGLTQEFYSPEHASRLALWLEFFLPTHLGEF